MKKLYIAWDSKGRYGLLSSLRGEALTIAAYNITLTFNPRGIDVVANIGDVKVYDIGKRKYVYIFLNERIKPLPTGKSDIVDKEFIGSFEVVVTRINGNNYLTIITPGSWLYNYVILTDDTLLIEMSSKKDVYFEKLEDEIVVHIV